jgi:hypothetical protein
VAKEGAGGQAGIAGISALAIPADREDMAVAVTGQPASRLPDAAFAPVGGRAIGGERLQTFCVMGQDPAVVIAEIPLRREGQIERLVHQQQSGALMFIKGVEIDRPAD